MNRDITINTFEGGIDLDSDNKVIKNNKTREAYNTDIKKSGNIAAITDLKGESVVSVLEDSSVYEVFVLASDSARLLVQPTKQSIDTIVFFYIRKSGNSHQFVVKILRENENGNCACIIEDITEDQFNFLKDSTVDFVKVGKFGYDVFYFVDNLRQPRKLECILYRTNDTELTLTASEPLLTDPFPNYKKVNLLVNPSGQIIDGFRAYIYGYKTGGSFSLSANNPLTETIKFVDFNPGDTTPKFVFFDIYEEDYSNWTFEIVYHREGEDVFSNFIIGDPSKIEVSIGILPNSFLLLQGSNLQPSSQQVNSWEFLYTGSVITVYSNDEEIAIGSILYNSPVESGENLLPTGFYQDITDPNSNKYVESFGGAVVNYEINNGDIIPEFNFPEIESEVKLNATAYSEGNVNRLSTANYNLPLLVTVNGEDYDFESITVRDVTENNNIKSYTVERAGDLTPLIKYSPGNIDLEVEIFDVNQSGFGYFVTMSAFINFSTNVNIDVVANLTATRTQDSQQISTPQFNITIPAGEVFASTQLYIEDGGQEFVELNFSNPCIFSFGYLGMKTINPVNQC